MLEWKEKIFEVKGMTQVSFVSSPAQWLNALQERHYIFTDTLQVQVLADGRLYVLVMVGEKGVSGLMNAFAGVPTRVEVSND